VRIASGQISKKGMELVEHALEMATCDQADRALSRDLLQDVGASPALAREAIALLDALPDPSPRDVRAA